MHVITWLPISKEQCSVFNKQYADALYTLCIEGTCITGHVGESLGY
ncbi:hypothetical protein ApDm4_2735 [Acetobacter pomorum]|nr:hypothetical protein ApDm4_2735 [Acetobacter pomorum]